MNNHRPIKPVSIEQTLKGVEFETERFDAQVADVNEAILREASARLYRQMQAVRERHIIATEAMKGRIVPKTNSAGKPVLGDNGRPVSQRLVFWYEVRVELKKPPKAESGLSFPRIYWLRRTGGTAKSSRSQDRKFCVGERVQLPDGSLTYNPARFAAANQVERDLIQKTEDRAGTLRAKAKFYSDLWKLIRHYRLSKHYVEAYSSGELEQ